MQVEVRTEHELFFRRFISVLCFFALWWWHQVWYKTELFVLGTYNKLWKGKGFWTRNQGKNFGWLWQDTWVAYHSSYSCCINSNPVMVVCKTTQPLQEEGNREGNFYEKSDFDAESDRSSGLNSIFNLFHEDCKDEQANIDSFIGWQSFTLILKKKIYQKQIFHDLVKKRIVDAYREINTSLIVPFWS